MTLIRTLRTAATVVTHTFSVDETPTDASTGVAVTVKRLDGSTVTSGSATHPGTGQYAFTVPGQALLDTLMVEWVATSIGGAVVTARDYVEVAGAFLFGLSEARNLRPPLDATLYPTDMLKRKRIEVEQEAERICGYAMVPRYGRAVLSGRNASTLRLPDIKVRSLRSVTVFGTALTSNELLNTYALDAGVLDRGYGVWPYGWNNIVAEYEHGLDYPPEGVHDMSMVRLRSRLQSTSRGVPDRAITWTAENGATYRIAMPSGEKTGNPDVDAEYERWAIDPGGFA